ncbi:hypothetical protein TVAGG3_0894080 [Trichomonas vaginalis G3]|uniref:hypothetical protein n=1 Tax=Trichomonas vaginalis (strain ATCC PRA-98 / G3) TaxID=412133 RepID=UPI0021E57348|nr:hypothetical protein TVAGG3_0894080 [Trichomonas vaginalis G3]KAI5502929.1 hypothetical protein TVAGG3_0894080 [Trichomonas vaginalis G3]
MIVSHCNYLQRIRASIIPQIKNLPVFEKINAKLSDIYDEKELILIRDNIQDFAKATNYNDSSNSEEVIIEKQEGTTNGYRGLELNNKNSKKKKQKQNKNLSKQVESKRPIYNLPKETKKLFYNKSDHLFIEQFEGKTYSNFSKIEITNHDVNDIISYPISINIKYISDDTNNPLILVSSDKSFITYSYENSMITLNIHHDTLQLIEKSFTAKITINKFEFSLCYKYNIVDSLCYIKIDDVDIRIDNETKRPIVSLNSQNKQLNISVFDNHFDIIPHWIDIYGIDVTCSQENNFLSKLSVKNNPNFGIVVHTCKEENNSMYTGIQFEEELDVKMIYHSRGDKKFIETNKLFAGIFKNINTFNIFGYDKKTMNVEMKYSDELDCSDLTITDRKLTLKICFPTKPKKENFIDFIFSCKDKKKIIHYNVIFPDATFEMNDDQICFSWNDEDLNNYPVNYYDFEICDWNEIRPKQFVPQPYHKFIMVTIFGFYFISYDEPNINCYIDFNIKNVYPDYVTNFCFLVIENNSRVRIVQEKQFNSETMVKTCIRLCSENFDPDYDDESNLWIHSWVPMSEDISYMKPILEKLSKKDLLFFFNKFYKFAREFKPKVNDQDSMIKSIVDIFVDKIRIIKKIKYRLICPIKINDIFEIFDYLSEMTNFQTQDWLDSLHYFDNNNSSNCQKDVIKFTRYEINTMNSNDIDMKKVDTFSFNFGDPTFQIESFKIEDAKNLNDTSAINLCLQLPYIIFKNSLSKDKIYFIYQSLIDYSKKSENMIFIEVFNQMKEIVTEKETQKEIIFGYDKTINSAKCKEQMETQKSVINLQQQNQSFAQSNNQTFAQQSPQFGVNTDQQSQDNLCFASPQCQSLTTMSQPQTQNSPQMLVELFTQFNQQSFVQQQDNGFNQNGTANQFTDPSQMMFNFMQAMNNFVPQQNQFSFVPQQVQTSENQQQNQFSFVPQQVQTSENQQQNQFSFVPQQVQTSENQQQNQFSFVPQQVQTSENQQQNQFSFVPQQVQTSENQQQNQFSFVPQQVQTSENQQQNQFSFVPQQVQTSENQQQNQFSFVPQQVQTSENQQQNQFSFVPQQVQTSENQQQNQFSFVPQQVQTSENQQQNQFSFVPQQVQTSENQQQNQFSFVPQQVQTSENQQQNQFSFVPQQVQTSENQQQNQFSFVPQQVQTSENQQQNQFSFVPQQVQTSENQQQNQFSFVPQQVQTSENQQQNQFSYGSQMIYNEQQNQPMLVNQQQQFSLGYPQNQQQGIFSPGYSHTNYSQISTSYMEDEGQSLFV